MRYFILTLGIFYSTFTFGMMAETVKATRVFKGDTVLVTNYKGKSVYVHLAGVDCPEMNQKGGPEAKAYLESLVQNKRIYATFTREEDVHALAMLSSGYSGDDIGAKMLEKGLCWYRNIEADNLRSVQRSSYKILADRARFKKLGIWRDGDIFFGNIDPESWRKLGVDQVDQPRFNGTPDPKYQGYNRPQPSERYPTTEGKPLPGKYWRSR